MTEQVEKQHLYDQQDADEEDAQEDGPDWTGDTLHPVETQGTEEAIIEDQIHPEPQGDEDDQQSRTFQSDVESDGAADTFQRMPDASLGLTEVDRAFRSDRRHGIHRFQLSYPGTLPRRVCTAQPRVAQRHPGRGIHPGPLP